MPALLDIYNLALLRIKESPLVSVETRSRQAQACEFSYSVQRPALLRAHRWPFALRRSVLAASTDAPEFGWKYKFLLPNDFVTIVAASPVAFKEITEVDFTAYRVEDGHLLSDSTPMYIMYVRDEKNTERFDPLFVNVLSYFMASDLALALAADSSLSEQMRAVGEQMLLRARRANAIEQPAEVVRFESRLIAERM